MRKLRSSAIVVCVCMLLLVPISPLALSATQDEEPHCEDGWASLSSAAYPGKIKVWATCTGAYGEDLR